MPPRLSRDEKSCAVARSTLGVDPSLSSPIHEWSCDGVQRDEPICLFSHDESVTYGSGIFLCGMDPSHLTGVETPPKRDRPLPSSLLPETQHRLKRHLFKGMSISTVELGQLLFAHFLKD